MTFRTHRDEMPLLTKLYRNIYLYTVLLVMSNVSIRNSIKGLIIVPICVAFLSILSSSKSQNNDFAQEDKSTIEAMINGNASVNWIFTGNSITQGAKHTHGMRNQPTFNILHISRTSISQSQHYHRSKMRMC